uniref:C2H2-type domain-containing protein n=1 Tax=Anas platyrhynchos platyrhynchos TaxID=8840 RepID=A0A493T277_ANAPP
IQKKQAHRRLHTGERPFGCPQCHKAFTQKAGLVLHGRLHTGARPYACSRCGKSFRSSMHLISHQLLESGERSFKCAACGKAFKQGSSLKQHLRTHEEREPHRCSVCSRAFSRSSYPQLHVRTHSSERLYHCLVCNRTYAKISTFEKHCKKHQQEAERSSVRPGAVTKALAGEKIQELQHQDDDREQPHQADGRHNPGASAPMLLTLGTLNPHLFLMCCCGLYLSCVCAGLPSPQSICDRGLCYQTMRLWRSVLPALQSIVDRGRLPNYPFQRLSHYVCTNNRTGGVLSSAGFGAMSDQSHQR